MKTNDAKAWIIALVFTCAGICAGAGPLYNIYKDSSSVHVDKLKLVIDDLYRTKADRTLRLYENQPTIFDIGERGSVYWSPGSGNSYIVTVLENVTYYAILSRSTTTVSETSGTVAGSLTVYGDIEALGNVSAGGVLTSSGAGVNHMAGSLDVDGPGTLSSATIQGDLGAEDIRATGQVEALGNVSAGGDLGVAGNATIRDSMTVTDDTYVSSNAIIGGTLQVGGATNIDNSLTMDSGTVLGDFGVTGEITRPMTWASTTTFENINLFKSNLYVLDEVGIGLDRTGSGGQLHFDDQSTDEAIFSDCYVGINNETPLELLNPKTGTGNKFGMRIDYGGAGMRPPLIWMYHDANNYCGFGRCVSAGNFFTGSKVGDAAFYNYSTTAGVGKFVIATGASPTLSFAIDAYGRVYATQAVATGGVLYSSGTGTNKFAGAIEAKKNITTESVFISSSATGESRIERNLSVGNMLSAGTMICSGTYVNSGTGSFANIIDSGTLAMGSSITFTNGGSQIYGLDTDAMTLWANSDLNLTADNGVYIDMSGTRHMSLASGRVEIPSAGMIHVQVGPTMTCASSVSVTGVLGVFDSGPSDGLVIDVSDDGTDYISNESGSADNLTIKSDGTITLFSDNSDIYLTPDGAPGSLDVYIVDGAVLHVGTLTATASQIYVESDVKFEDTLRLIVSTIQSGTDLIVVKSSIQIDCTDANAIVFNDGDGGLQNAIGWNNDAFGFTASEGYTFTADGSGIDYNFLSAGGAVFEGMLSCKNLVSSGTLQVTGAADFDGTVLFGVQGDGHYTGTKTHLLLTLAADQDIPAGSTATVKFDTLSASTPDRWGEFSAYKFTAAHTGFYRFDFIWSGTGITAYKNIYIESDAGTSSGYGTRFVAPAAGGIHGHAVSITMYLTAGQFAYPSILNGDGSNVLTTYSTTQHTTLMITEE